MRPEMDSREGYWTRHDDFRTMLGFLENGKLKVKPIIHNVVSPADCGAVYKDLCHSEKMPLGIAFDWSKID